MNGRLFETAETTPEKPASYFSDIAILLEGHEIVCSHDCKCTNDSFCFVNSDSTSFKVSSHINPCLKGLWVIRVNDEKID